MGFFDHFRSEKKQSAAMAKDRLQIIVARERSHRASPDYVPRLQQELLEVIRRYVAVDDDAVRMQVDREGDREVLELNVTLPEDEQPGRAAGGR